MGAFSDVGCGLELDLPDETSAKPDQDLATEPVMLAGLPGVPGRPAALPALGQVCSSATAVRGSTHDSTAHTPKAPAASGAVWVNAAANWWLPR